MKFEKRFSLFLLPSLFQSVVSFLVLPFTTTVLGPKDYGLFGLVSAITAIGTNVAPMGSSLYLAAHFQNMKKKDLRNLISTVLAIGICFLILFSVAVLAAWPVFTRHWEKYAIIPHKDLVTVLFSMFLSFPWVIAMDISTLTKKVSDYAIVTILQTAVSTVTLLVCLFLLKWGGFSLFAGALAGSAMTLVGAFIVLRPYLALTFDHKIFHSILRVNLTSAVGNLLEVLHMNLERFVISYNLGLEQLGLYTHSQRYRDMMAVPVGAVGRAIWPTALAEARDPHSTFSRMTSAWNLVYLMITVAGIFFATLGKYFISLMTHGKFTQAYPYAVCWVIFLLLQYSGRQQLGVIQALGHMQYYSKMIALATVASILSLFLLVPVLGGLGAIAAAAVQQGLFRIAIRFKANRLRKFPFYDGWLLVGFVSIPVVWVVSETLRLGPAGNFELFCTAVAALGFLARGILRNGFVRISDLLGK